MPFDSSGNYKRDFPPGGWTGDATNNFKIEAARHDLHDQDLADALSMMICKDGQSSVTANITMSGFKLINLGPTVPADPPTNAATKGYVDAIKSFSTGIVIPGNAINGRVTFSGAEVAGLSWTHTGADLGFGVREAGSGLPSRFVFSTTANFSGPEAAVIFEDGTMRLGPSVAPLLNNSTSLFASYGLTAHNSFALNLFRGADSAWHAHTAGWGAALYLDEATGALQLLKTGSASTSPSQSRGLGVMLDIHPTTFDATFVGDVRVSHTPTNAIFSADGNINGEIWKGYGGTTPSTSLYVAIGNYIDKKIADARTAAAKLTITQTRMGAQVHYVVGGGGDPKVYEYPGHVVTGIRRQGSDSYEFYWRQPQIFVEDGWAGVAPKGWLVAFPYDAALSIPPVTAP